MAILFCVVFSVMAAFAMLLPSFLFFLENLGASKAAATQVLACYSLSQFVAGPILGRLSDRVGRRPVILTGLAGAILCYGNLAFNADSVAEVLFSLIGAGLCSGIVAVSFAAVADITAPSARSKGLGMIGASIGLAFTAGPAFGAYLASEQAALAVITTAAKASCLVLVFGFIVGTRLKHGKKALASLATKALEKPTQEKTGDNTISTKPSVASVGQRGVVGKIRSMGLMAQRPIIGVLCVLMFLFTISLAMMEPVTPYLVHDRYGWGPKDMGALFAYAGLLVVLVQGKLIGPLTRRFGEKTLMRTGIVFMATGLLCMMITPVSGGMWLGFTFTSIGGAMFNTSLLALTSQKAAGSERGLVLGMVQSMQALARTFGPLVAGFLYQQVSILPLAMGVGAMGLAFWGAIVLFRLAPMPSNPEKNQL
ncbi:MAG: MFS transporter [Kordiimonadaceae bacterium]|nr:MFS transporter [Kordiimonadaceae bacterium]